MVAAQKIYYGYPWDGGQPLSACGDDSSTELIERVPHVLLRPVFINAVEVGFAYSQVDRDRRLQVRGVTLALWYFLSRGHQALALLPHCFKTYPDKSSCWTELMALFRMNLIEFTPGFGSDKYLEVNRILATRARETGGCIVARSQMHTILDESPQLDKTVEKRLLMPSFNGDDLIFPIDGPLGRIGQPLNQTLRCEPGDMEWGRCSHHQMLLVDQRYWIQRLAALVPANISWLILSSMLDEFRPTTSIHLERLPVRPASSLHEKIRPPDARVPPQNEHHKYQHHKYHRHEHGASKHNAINHKTEPIQTYTPTCDFFLPDYFLEWRQSDESRDQADVAPRPAKNSRARYPNRGNVRCQHCAHIGHGAEQRDRSGTAQHHYRRGAGRPPHINNARLNQRSMPKIGNDLTSLQRYQPPANSSSNRHITENFNPTDTQRRAVFDQVATILGWENAKRVTTQHPKVLSVQMLIELAFDSQPETSTSTTTSSSDATSSSTQSSPKKKPKPHKIPSSWSRLMKQNKRMETLKKHQPTLPTVLEQESPPLLIDFDSTPAHPADSRPVIINEDLAALF